MTDAIETEYAAAFFLLAGSPKDAVSVIFSSLKDPQLAITVARVYEGSDSGPVLRNLLESKVLPHAVAEGNRWLASWTFWMLQRKDMAVRALLSPLSTLHPLTATPQNPDSRLFLLNDPALIIFYKHIRSRTTTTLKGAYEITPAMEWGFVVATARVYDRMGCDLLALDLVKNWEFLHAERNVLAINPNSDSHARDLLRKARRNSKIIADDILEFRGEKKKDAPEVSEKIPAWKEGLVEPPAAVWEEPDMSWAF